MIRISFFGTRSFLCLRPGVEPFPLAWVLLLVGHNPCYHKTLFLTAVGIRKEKVMNVYSHSSSKGDGEEPIVHCLDQSGVTILMSHLQSDHCARETWPRHEHMRVFCKQASCQRTRHFSSVRRTVGGFIMKSRGYGESKTPSVEPSWVVSYQ